ncbi:hypothetical protein EKD04_005295 [Chloroflexales bacterium ZM16-3]|nr:hypothetical protein [Chloroflexales bacterium ZM16-3]
MTDPIPAKLNLDQLLRMGVAAARSGNRNAAHALFLAIAREYPHDVRPWLGLAGVATSAQEQRDALEHVIAIDPDHPKARQGLASLAPAQEQTPPSPAATAVASTPPVDSPALSPDQQRIEEEKEREEEEQEEEQKAAAQRFPLMNMVALGIMALLIIILIVVVSGLYPRAEQRADTTVPPPSPVLQAAPPLPATEAPSSNVPSSATDESPTTGPIPTAQINQGSTATQPTAPAGLTPAVGLPTAASLPLGTLIEVDDWSATLLRPDYALILDGSIGDLNPSGRFVLALMAISNNSAEPRRIPADLLTLVDSRGRRYSPASNASTAYLTLYGRGQHGDLALEDSLTPHSGMRSVPILFDVPNDATGLVLTVRDSGTAGWPIESAVAPDVNVGP